jgi:hypothetical protein
MVMNNPHQKKNYKGGEIVIIKPYDMQLLDSEPLIREAFQRVACINFCQTMKRGHLQLAKRNRDMLAKVSNQDKFQD